MEAQETRTIAAKYRRPSKPLRIATVLLPLLAMVFAVLYLTHMVPWLEFAYLYLMVTLLLPLIFIWVPVKSTANKEGLPWYDALLAFLGFAIPLYFFIRADAAVMSWGTEPPTIPLVLAIVLWAMILEASRRAVGWVFFGVVLFFSVYPLFGSIMPGPLWAPAFQVKELTAFYVLGMDSLMGIVMQVFGKILFGFFVFAVAIQAAGAGRLFNNLAMALLGNTRGGPAKIAIVASGFLGSISGSSIANVMTTGAFTIPAMKKNGFPPHFAAAVEACASTGGAIMPPIMGAVAFIMAEFIQVSYAEVCIAAAVPSILYYLVLYVQIDAFARRVGIEPSGVDVTNRSKVILLLLWEHLHILISLFGLVYILFWMRLETYAPWAATAFLLLVTMIKTKGIVPALKFFITFVEDSGRIVGELVGILAPLGFIIGALTITGVAYSLPYEIVSFAHGNLYLMLVIGALASFILGMGVSIGACYIFLAIVLCPGLVKGGFDVMAVHLFVLYCGLWSFITPPVALSAFAAAAIAESDPMQTGFTAMRLGIAKYLLPFFFVISPALILRGPVFEVVTVTLSCALGLTLISLAFERYIWGIGKVGIILSVLVFVAGFLIALPNRPTDFIGIGIMIVSIGGFFVIRNIRKAH